ncbi:energy transducer TonB [Aureimonas sp. AU20]|uniref:energy transducer TonB n=1 Tax=Aureimonas sp. AU20 TaxID=1349819 RepID=UPI000721CB9E|nr:energy transducer TonB [Aureimonas sp. AU20]ALN74456.1 hypothetical protein M673_17135 [Aureimonas sp. AU20]
MTLAYDKKAERGGSLLGAMRWGTAALAVAALHAGAAFYVSNMPAPEAPPQGTPEAAVLIDLAPPAPPPSAPAAEAPPVEAPPEEVPPEPQLEPTPEPVPPPPEPVAPPPEPAPPEPPPPEPVAEPEPPPPEPIPEPEPLPEPPPPEPVVTPEVPKMEAPPEVAERAAVPLPRPTPPRPRVAEKPPERPTPPKPRRERPREEARPRTPPRAAPPPSRASQASRAPTTQGAAVSSSAVARWKSQVQSRLNRFKRTPPGGAVGMPSVTFTIGPSGAASNIRIARSSGNPILDQAALDLVRRASPFPSPPSGESVSIPPFAINYKR